MSMALNDLITAAANKYVAAPLPGVYTQYAPTVVSSTGTLTSYTSTAYWCREGDRVTLHGYVVITDKGTGAGTLNVTLPVAAAGALAAVGVGRENSVTGSQLQVNVSPAAVVATISNYANATIIATNAQVRFTIIYMAA